jgi:hypothetical protein
LDEQKECLELNRWIDFLGHQAEREGYSKELALEVKQIGLQKAAECFMKLINRNNSEKAKLFRRLWNENIFSSQTYINSLMSNLETTQEE